MQKKNIVLFDMDNTLVSANTGALWGSFLDKKGIVTSEDRIAWQELQVAYDEGTIDPHIGFEFVLEIMRRIPHHEKDLWTQEFFHNMVKDKTSRRALELIKQHKEEPDTMVVMITASLSFIASLVANHAGVHGFIATEGETVEGRYTGKIAGIPCLGHGKIHRFEQWTNENKIIPIHTTLYSDSINDLPLLNYVKKPVVVDPDKYLKPIAIEKNWEVMTFLDLIQTP